MQFEIREDGIRQIQNFLRVFPAGFRDRVLRQVGTNIANKIEEMVNLTTASWEHKPAVRKEISLNNGLKVVVTIADEAWVFVTLGTSPHTISSRGANPLVFSDTYAAKTSPNVLGSNSGGASGNPVFSFEVYHPGTQPRNFHKLIIERLELEAPKLLEEATRNLISSLI